MKTAIIVRPDPRIFPIGVILMLMTIVAAVLPAYGASSSSSPAETKMDVRKEANVFFARGEAYEEQEKYAEAEEQYRRAVNIDGKYAEAYSNLGYSLRKQGKYKEAVKYYKKAIKLKPDLAEAHEYLGEAYAELGKLKKAEKHLKILRDLGSDEAEELEAFIQKKKNS